MPEQIIATAIDRLDEAIHQQELIVDEVRALRTSNKRLRAIIAGLAVVIVFGGVGLWTSFRASQDARDAARAVAELQHQQEADRAQRAADACTRSITVRDDSRAMWLYAFAAFPDSSIVADLRRKLDERLPTLTCVDDIPTATTTPGG